MLIASKKTDNAGDEVIEDHAAEQFVRLSLE